MLEYVRFALIAFLVLGALFCRWNAPIMFYPDCIFCPGYVVLLPLHPVIGSKSNQETIHHLICGWDLTTRPLPFWGEDQTMKLSRLAPSKTKLL